MASRIVLSLRVPYEEKTFEQRFYFLICKTFGRVPTEVEWRNTPMNFSPMGLRMRDFRAFYLSLWLFNRRDGYLGVRSRVRHWEKPLSLDRLLSRYRENKALRYVVRIMCERWWEANDGESNKWICFNKNLDRAGLVDTVYAFRIYAGSTIGWHKDMHELMFETDFLYYNNRRHCLYVNPNYFVHWMNKHAYWLMIGAYNNNLHLRGIKEELEGLSDVNSHNLRSRHGIYREGYKRWIENYKAIGLKRISLSY